MSRMTRRTGALLLVAVAFGSCAGDDPGGTTPGSIEVTVRDSAGVRIVESAGSALETRLPWVLDSLPDLQLGSVEGGGPTGFADIAGVAGLMDGSVVVLDGGSAEIRWFDATGEFLRSAGGDGDGPSEFRRPMLVPQFQPDSLLVHDRGRSGFVRVATDGSGMRRLRLPNREGGALVGTPRAATESHVIFRSGSSFRACRENEGCELDGILRAVRLGTNEADTLAVHVSRMLDYSRGDGPRLLTIGILDQKGLVAAAPDGPVVEGGPRFELKQLDDDGELATIIRVDAPPRGPSSREANEQYAQRSPDPAELIRIFEMMGLPEEVPAYQALLVDALGWYWAELFRVADRWPAEWLVFSPAREAQGVIELPPGLEVHFIGEDYILGLWTNELGVEFVRRYPLDRS